MKNRLPLAFASALAASLALAGCKDSPAAPPAAAPPAPPPPVASAPAPAPPPAATPAPPPAPAGRFMAAAEAGTPLWATVKTTMGDISLVLYSKDAPRTVANFVGLATGEKSWRDPRSGQQAPAGKPLYTDTIFHRVIPEFMIQGGDPEGSGRGDPGYRFADEFQSGRKFDHPGILAMANAGPGTNGSQFFITVKPVPWLNDHHTVFGDVVSGFDVVQAIANTPRDADDRPRTEVRILGISITFQNPKR